MTLQEAIDTAFGQSEFVRCAHWPKGSVAQINPMSTDPLDPFAWTMGRRVLVHNPPTDDDLHADDWYPCDHAGEASVDGSNPAICGHRKAGHFRRPETGVEFYFTASCVGKDVWTLVRQLRGPHLRMWA